MTTRAAWVTAFTLADLPPGEARLFAHDERRIAVFRTEEGEALAVDNRCPHEGYPLIRGAVKGCVVTCIWHNFKFDLRDGRCLLGDEHVRAYPLRIRDGKIELDLSDPDPAAEINERFASLVRGAHERRLGQIARDIVRLLQLGATPAAITAAAVRFDAEYTDYGTTHALPVACDALALAPAYAGVDAVLPLIQAFDLASESHLRRPKRTPPPAIDPGDDLEAAGDRLRAAVEAEEAELAEGLLRGALARPGCPRATIERWLYRVCADHFLDFGHALIYQVKIFDLLGAIGWAEAPVILPAHLLRIVYATREEQVPEWRWLCAQLSEHTPRFAGWFAANVDAAGPRARALEDALIDGDREAVIDALVAGLDAGLGLRRLSEALIVGGAARLLRFDPAIDGDPTVQEGLLDVTHRLTFALAAAIACERFREPAVLRLLFFAASFIDRARPLDRAGDDPDLAGLSDQPVSSDIYHDTSAAGAAADQPVSSDIYHDSAATEAAPTHPVPSDMQDDDPAAAVVAALQRQDPSAALTLAAAALAQDPEALRRALTDASLRDPRTRPIFAGHCIKTCVAAFDARERLGDHPRRDLPVLAYVRAFASPTRERALVRLCHEAIGFVVHGKVPRTLS